MNLKKTANPETENRHLNDYINRLEEILNHAPLFLCVLEIDRKQKPHTAKVLWCNQQIMNFTGYSREEIDQSPCEFIDHVLHPKDRAQLISDILSKPVPDNSPMLIKAFRAQCSKNQFHWIISQISVMDFGDNGMPVRVLHTAFAISGTRSFRWISNALYAMHRANHQNLIELISKREMEVLQLVVCGLTDQEIAHTLFISHRTAQTHRYNLLRKTGTNNTAQLVVFAIKCGLVSE